MKTLLILLAIALSITGCASLDYKSYTDGQVRIETARQMAETEKYKAMATLGTGGSDVAKVVALMSINAGGNGPSTQTAKLTAPESPGDTALRWLGVLAPVSVQVLGIAANTRATIRQSDNATTLGIVQSNNAAATANSTNGTFAAIGSSGLRAATEIGASGLSAATSISSLIKSNVTTTTDSHAVDTHSVDSHLTNPAQVITTPAGQVCAIDSTGKLACQ